MPISGLEKKSEAFKVFSDSYLKIEALDEYKLEEQRGNNLFLKDLLVSANKVK
jgi:hypothetical protein